MKQSGSLAALSALIGLLALLATVAGLFWPADGGPYSVTTLRGGPAVVYGSGLYRYDSLFIGTGNRGTDVVTLVVGLPLLALSTILYRRGSLRAGLVLTGTLVYFLYVYVSYALGTAYNPLFLVYVALFSASLFAFILAFTAVDVPSLARRFGPGLPRRWPGAFMIASSLVTVAVWLGPLIAALVGGQTPERLDFYTTKVTEALDVATITPAAFLAGTLILRGRPLGYLIAFSLLVLEAMLAPLIAVQTISQVSAGVTFPPGQIIGMMGGFGVLALLAIWTLVSLLRHVSDSPQTRARPG